MRKSQKTKIDVQGTEITVRSHQAQDEDFISLTDIARSRETGRPDDLIRNWLRNRDTVEFLGTWERLYNPDFNPVEFDGIRIQTGLNSYSLTPKQWIEKTGAIGITSETGRYGGTFAHPDIAFEFASWISVEFRLYLIKEFQRLKTDENRRLVEGERWNLHRALSKINYQIHTDAVQSHIIPQVVSATQARIAYASEGDLLNVALFGKTAKQWRDSNPQLEGNMRDYATVEQLLILANLESLNAELIRLDWSAEERLKQLNKTAIAQLETLTAAAHKLQSGKSPKKLT
jgi:hypothetical protein